ncbi:MBL fold metallo-hydrolase [Shewanella sp. NFH-SH190041]|uniref:MBL fold metallo-hydrolase n=1 Tax=Shewanella sp. NFH-SH190041 TaxID=2950245 RepID=UPI0021C40305|nr:MBL fold metallo-hydrolase [Shewanella sp. NFH-SH190041]BDM63895.1 MBL fold metallo-hydrolase [Shewanella sp. NFH-SH190041]
MKYVIIPVTPYQQNCTLMWCENTNKAAVVDPGGNLERIIEAVERHGVTVDKVLLTHGHLDHVGAAKQLAHHYGVEIIGPHEGDQFLLDDLPHQCQSFGFPPCEAFVPDHYLQDGDEVAVGDIRLQVLHCPGHTPGHIVFFNQDANMAWVGDVLFRGSIGRTDFPGSNHGQLLNAITTKLWPLGTDVAFIPGHGPGSTFGEERKHNPFVADQLFE